MRRLCRRLRAQRGSEPGALGSEGRANYNPNAVSRGSQGLMQADARDGAVANVTNPFDPAQNVDAGVRHLKGCWKAMAVMSS